MRVVHPDLFPPFASIEAGHSVGLVVDIVRGAAERAGWRADFVAVPFDRIETALSEGIADVSIPIAVTDERRQRFDFSQTLLMTGGSLFVRAGSETPQGLQSLTGKVVVTPRSGPLAEYIARTAREVRLVVTDDYEESLDKLASGEADAAALNHQTGAMIAARLYPSLVTVPQTMFLELPLAAAALKGQSAELIAALDAGLSAPPM